MGGTYSTSSKCTAVPGSIILGYTTKNFRSTNKMIENKLLKEQRTKIYFHFIKLKKDLINNSNLYIIWNFICEIFLFKKKTAMSRYERIQARKEVLRTNQH